MLYSNVSVKGLIVLKNIRITMKTPVLSISIVSFNVKELLRCCIKSVYKNIHGVSFEIFVVDNNSSDGSREMVRTEFPQVELIANQTNAGYAKAINQVIALSKSPFILILNSDTEVKKDSIHKMLKFMVEHETIGAVGPKLLNPDGSIQPSYNRKFPGLLTVIGETLFTSSIKYALHKNRYVKNYLIKQMYGHHNVNQEVGWTGGACLLVRRKSVDEIGVMDENFFFFYEEMEWCLRMKKGGWKVYYLPEAEVVHHWGKSAERVSDRMFIESHKSRLHYFRKYYGTGALGVVRLLTIIEILTRGAILSLLKPFLPGKRDFIKGRLSAYAETIKYVIWGDDKPRQ